MARFFFVIMPYRPARRMRISPQVGFLLLQRALGGVRKARRAVDRFSCPAMRASSPNLMMRKRIMAT
jgi:hypothetical protein